MNLFLSIIAKSFWVLGRRNQRFRGGNFSPWLRQAAAGRDTWKTASAASSAEEVTSWKSRGGKIFTYHYPRSWHNVTFGKYARSYVRKVGEPEDEPQAGLALKRQSAKRGWNARLSSDCTLQPTLRLFIVAFLVFLTQSARYIFRHFLAVQQDSTNSGCRHRELYYYVLLRHTAAWRDDLSLLKFFQIFDEMFIIKG